MAADADKHVWENEDEDLVVVLDLPGGPREYVIADVDAETGRWATRLFQKTQAAKRRSDAGEDVEDIDADLHLSDEAERDLYGAILGPTLDDLEADGVKWKKTQLVGQVAYAWVVRGLEGARAMWEADPKPNRQQRRAASRASGSKTRAVGASASTTKPRASTSGTKTRNRA